jgi:hypothetical protein
LFRSERHHDFAVVAACITSFFIANSFYFFAIYGGIRKVVFCCDASGYVEGAENFVEFGWLAETVLEGYRSILNYAGVAAIRAVGFIFQDAPFDRGIRDYRHDAPYVVGALLIFSLLAMSAIAVFSKWKGFLPAFAAAFLSPIGMAFLPLPTQESQMVLVLGPLIFAIYLLLHNGRNSAAVVTLGVFAGAAWMIKPSFLIIACAAWALAAYICLRSLTIKSATLSLLLGVVAFGAIIAPQVHVASTKFASFSPYPKQDVMRLQLAWGTGLWRYETYLIPFIRPVGRGRYFRTNTEPVPVDQYASYMLSNPGTAAALVGGHLIGAFDYTHLKTYITTPKKLSFAPFNIVVGFVMFIGMMQWFRTIIRQDYGREDYFLDSIFFGVIVVFPFIAVETRFSLLAMLVVTLRTGMWVVQNLPCDKRATDAFGGVLFGFVLASAHAVMWSTA